MAEVMVKINIASIIICIICIWTDEQIDGQIDRRMDGQKTVAKAIPPWQK